MPDLLTEDVVNAHGHATWDYSVLSIHARHNDILEQQLKEMGSKGWELFFINMPMANEYQCIFRRLMP